MTCRNSLIIAGFLATPLHLAGCTSSQVQPASLTEIPPGLEDVKVSLLIDPNFTSPWAGSGVPISEHVMLTCMHVFPFKPETPQPMWIDGHDVSIFVYQWGGPDWTTSADDWMLFFTTSGAVHPNENTVFDFSRPVKPGDTVYLVGFPGDATKIDREAAKSLTRTTLISRVTDNPQSEGSGTLRVEVPKDAYLPGMSGGAALIYDKDSKQWVVIGICRAGAFRKFTIGVADWTTNQYLTVVRPRVR